MQLNRPMTKREIEILDILRQVDKLGSDGTNLLEFLSNDLSLAKHGITDKDKDLVKNIYRNIELYVRFFDMNNLPWFSYDDGVFSVYATVYGIHTNDICLNWDSRYSIDEHLETLHDALILGVA